MNFGTEWVSFLAAQAQKYAALRKPYLINDMVMQDVLLDRRRVYGSLQVNMPSIHSPCTHEQIGHALPTSSNRHA